MTAPVCTQARMGAPSTVNFLVSGTHLPQSLPAPRRSTNIAQNSIAETSYAQTTAPQIISLCTQNTSGMLPHSDRHTRMHKLCTLLLDFSYSTLYTTRRILPMSTVHLSRVTKSVHKEHNHSIHKFYSNHSGKEATLILNLSFLYIIYNHQKNSV